MLWVDELEMEGALPLLPSIAVGWWSWALFVCGRILLVQVVVVGVLYLYSIQIAKCFNGRCRMRRVVYLGFLRPELVSID